MKVMMTRQAQEQAEDLPEVIHRRVRQVVARLEKWPAVSGAKPLRGNLAGRYRLRTGDYRVQFYVSQDRVIVEKIGHRDGFYGE